jgi:acetylornithine deacetylase/succinyl-diaminopimelate desuccinylase-like protein
MKGGWAAMVEAASASPARGRGYGETSTLSVGDEEYAARDGGHSAGVQG